MSSNIVHSLASLSDHYYRNNDEEALDAISFCLSKLSPQALGVAVSVFNDDQEPKAPMEYYSIYETNHFHICIIVLRKGRIIPLHDHPGMVVFSTLISGTINIETYQWLESAQSSHPTSNQAAEIDRKTVHEKSPDSVMRICHSSGPTLHAFECVSDYAVILDVLGPPYGEDRGCKYYKTKEGSSKTIDDRNIVTLEEYNHEDEDVVEYTYTGEKVAPSLFRKTAVDILSLVHKLDDNLEGSVV